MFSTWIHESLKPGDTHPGDGAGGPLLRARSTPSAERHYLGIAGGSGITPILSIMKTVLAAEPGSRFTLIYGNRSSRSTMFLEELEDLKNRYLSRLTLHLVFSQESTDLPLYGGRIDREKIGEFLGTLVDPASIDHAFVCGPHGVNDEAEAALLAAGVPAERIHIERFGIPDAAGVKPVQPAREGDAADAQVTIIRDGVQQRHRLPLRTRATCSTPLPPPGSRCRSPASRASAAPAAPSCSRARCGWNATSRWRSTRSRPASF